MGFFLVLAILITGGVLFIQFGLFACALLLLNYLGTYLRKKSSPAYSTLRGTKIILISSALLLIVTFSSYVHYVLEEATCLNMRASACDELYKSIAGRYWKMNIGTGLVGTASISTLLKVINNK